MAKYDTVQQRLGSHVLLMGDPKVGKSTLAAALLELRYGGFNLYWISTDMGHTVIGKLSKDARDRSELIVLPDTNEYPIAIETVRSLFKGGEKRICDAHGKINCTKCTKELKSFTTWNFSALTSKDIVVLDHLSGVADSCFNLICRGKKNDKGANKDITVDGETSYKPELDDWGALKKHMAELMLSIQNAPYNIIAIAHCTEAVLEDKSKKIVPQVGSDATSRTVGKYFDHIVYCDIKNATHKYGSMTNYQASIMTGSRTDVAIETMAQPSLLPFFDGTVQPAKAEVQGEKVAASVIAALPVLKPTTTLNMTKLLKGLK